MGVRGDKIARVTRRQSLRHRRDIKKTSSRNEAGGREFHFMPIMLAVF